MEKWSHLAQRLSQVKHFRDLSDADRESIVAAGHVRQVPTDILVFHEGAPCAGLFVLLDGRVHLTKLGPQGQETILAVVKPVIMFNEVAALDNGPNVVTAIATKASLLWQMSHAALIDLLMQFPQISYGLASVMATRNRFLVEQIEDLSFRTVLARTAKLLLEISHDGLRPVDRSSHPNIDLAARIATVPEAFSRSLHILKKNGCIDTSRDILEIVNAQLMAQIAEAGPILLPED